MSSSVSRSQVLQWIGQLQAAATKAECRACDCFQGLLVQLELDAAEDIADLVGPLRVASSEIHGCLGCDPCPPGAAFSDYLRCIATCSCQS